MIGRLVHDAYRTSVDVETASCHLWRLHQVAGARRGRGARRTLVSALAAVLLFATTGGAVALSGDAIPGDSLYLVKRGAERVHLLVSFAPESDARLHLRFARSRVAEAQRVAASRPDRVPVLLSEIVAAVDRAEVVGGGALSHEVELVREEVSTVLSTLNEVVDPELAASVGATLRELESDRAVSGSRVAPPADSRSAEPPGGEWTEGDEVGRPLPADQDRQPAHPIAPGEPSEPGEPDAELATPPVEQPPPPVGEATAPAAEQPGDAPTEAPAGSWEATPSEPPGTPEDTAIPILDRLEGLLDDADGTPEE